MMARSARSAAEVAMLRRESATVPEAVGCAGPVVSRKSENKEPGALITRPGPWQIPT
jgi:hypothetical protein